MSEDDDRAARHCAGPPPSEIGEATDWLLRQKDHPGDAGLAHDLQVWLGGSPSRRRAFEKASRAWTRAGDVPPAFEAAWRNAPSRHGARPRAAPQPSGRRRVLGLFAAAAAGLAIWIATPALLVTWQADYLTGTAERQILTLSDGSEVTLGADSAIAVDVAGARRQLALLSGEVFLDVAPDARRPFEIVAAGTSVTVVGTRLDMRLTSEELSIELEEGSVALVPARERVPVTLAAGEAVAIERATGALVRTRIDLADVGAWRRGKIFVDGATIGSVVETIRRYHRAYVAMPDPALAAQRVTGLYDLADPDRALAALVEPHGGKVRAVSPFLRVLSRF